jgi:glycosyltransferase involved in cell wall biosynthesis
MQPLVSILIPAFNAETWIAGAISSALGQTWVRKEIIVVDDGSKDGTLASARRFESPLVTIVTQANEGASAARNHAFSLCKGNYIQWLDADDLLAPDKIARQMDAAERYRDPRLLFSGAWGSFFYRTSCADFSPSPLWSNLSPVDWLLRKMRHNLHMQPDSWLVSRELTEKAGPWDTSLWRDNDGEYFCRVILASSGIRFVEEARSYYRRVGRTSISHVGTSQKKIESLFRSLNLHVIYLRSLEESDRTREASVAYLNTWMDYFYPERMDLVESLRQLAAGMKGRLGTPALSWKYHYVRRLFGWRAAKHLRRCLRLWKESGQRSWDHLLWKLDNLGLPRFGSKKQMTDSFLKQW